MLATCSPDSVKKRKKRRAKRVKKKAAADGLAYKEIHALSLSSDFWLAVLLHVSVIHFFMFPTLQFLLYKWGIAFTLSKAI